MAHLVEHTFYHEEGGPGFEPPANTGTHAQRQFYKKWSSRQCLPAPRAEYEQFRHRAPGITLVAKEKKDYPPCRIMDFVNLIMAKISVEYNSQCICPCVQILFWLFGRHCRFDYI